jgi:hypothetical protein
MFHTLFLHLLNNWHKYGVIILLFREFRVIYHLIAQLRDAKDNLTWIWQKICWPFKKIANWLSPKNF